MKQNVRLRERLQLLAAAAAVAAVLLPLFLLENSWPVSARDYLEERGVEETGAINLVSAIYLGYRAFDTLGETIVLLVAVSGAIGIAARAGKAGLAKGYDTPGNRTGDSEAKGNGSAPDYRTAKKAVPANPPIFAIPEEKRKAHSLRTHLLEVVTGKLGPVVLVFGFYVMLYGHLSPGGGFQGGVVIASGIVFLALGSRADTQISLNRATTLARIEATAFLLLVLAAISGIPAGWAGGRGGFFANPMAGIDALPAGFIILLNAVIGLKVGAGIGFMCIAMLGKE